MKIDNLNYVEPTLKQTPSAHVGWDLFWTWDWTIQFFGGL